MTTTDVNVLGLSFALAQNGRWSFASPEDLFVVLNAPHKLKRFFSLYMAMTFNSTSLAREILVAALPPCNLTPRTQIVVTEWNPRYSLINCFKELISVGANWLLFKPV